MDNPLTYLNSLFETFAEKTLSGHDQLIMLHIYNKFNRARWPETVRISDREIQELCRLYDSKGNPVTIQTIRNARGRLKLKGLIDFKAGKGDSATEYSLPFKHPYDTPYNTPYDTSAVPYIRAREDVKTLDSSIGYLSARAQENSELDKILEYWGQTLKGGRLSFEHQSQLAAWLAKFGYQWLEEAMREASDANGNSHGLNFKLLRGVVERKANPKKPKLRLLKGSGKVEKQEYHYEPADENDGIDLSGY